MFSSFWYVTIITMTAGASLNGNNIFSMVSNKFPLSDLSKCLLGTINIGHFCRPKVPCITACAKNPRCYLACYNESFCFLYSATVSVYYDATNGQYQPATKLLNGECYSSFVENNDITAQIKGTYVSSTTNGYVNSLAYDGYYCPAATFATVSYFYSYDNNSGPNWLIADLGKPYKITKLIVQTRTVWQNYFHDIEVRIGNQNSTGNSLWVSYPGPAVDGSVVTLKGASPARGRYVSINALNAVLVLPEIKIIGE